MTGTGIDFGTSNSVAACYDGKRVVLVELEENDAVMPTATHLSKDLMTCTGQAAVDRYVEDNRDRIVELIPEVIAKSTIVTGEADRGDPYSEAAVATADVYGQPWVDRGMPGRLFRGIKRLLGNADIKRLLVFDHPFRVVALVTPILLRIREAIEEELNGSLNDVHFGHPILFEGHDRHRNALAFSRLEEACHHADIHRLSFYPEPVAATLSYLHDQQTPDDATGTVLTLDFGGGTLDLSVVKFRGVSFNVLSTAGMSLGGDHIDQLIFRELLFPLLGQGETWVRVNDGRVIENEFPFNEFADKLLNWAVTYTLNQNQYRSKIASRISQVGASEESIAKFERLDDLITHNYSYLVFQAIKDAKARLSTVEETILDIPELDISISFTRERLERMMSGMLDRIDTIIDQVTGDADCRLEDIDVVIRTGGSSQIVAIRRLLEDKFPDRVTEHDPFTSVAAGLAIADYHGYQFQNPA